MPFFSKNGRHFFSRGRMDTRVGAFESPMSQLSQEFLFVFIALLKKALHHLKVGGNPFWGDIKWHFFEISELKNHQKNQKIFFVQNFHQIVFTCFHVFPGDSSTPKHLFYGLCHGTNPQPFQILSRKKNNCFISKLWQFMSEEKMGIFWVKFELRSFDIFVSSAEYLK